VPGVCAEEKAVLQWRRLYLIVASTTPTTKQVTPVHVQDSGALAGRKPNNRYSQQIYGISRSGRPK